MLLWSWVSCSTTPVDLLAQETVSMARSDALTLLDVMQAVREAAANEQETLDTVGHLLTSGQVRLSDDAMKAIQELSAITDVAA
jgi:Lhr-like helicase